MKDTGFKFYLCCHDLLGISEEPRLILSL